MISQDIFIKQTKNLFEEKNGVININFTESLQKGGNYSDNIIHISLSSSSAAELAQNGGSSDTSDYFNRLAEKIVNKSKSQKGGFDIKTKIDDSSDIFLSSETINEIKNGTNLVGGSKKKQFNFNELKNHLKRTIQGDLSGGSDKDDDEDDEDDEDEDIFLNDSDDEEDEDDISKIFKSSSNTDSAEEKYITKGVKNEHSLLSKRATNTKRTSSDSDIVLDEDSTDEEDEEDEEDDEDEENDDEDEDDNKENKMKNVKKTMKNESESLSLGGSSEYNLSDSISSPKLISYRKINDKTIIGRRYL
jgi:hypothetical protein